MKILSNVNMVGGAIPTNLSQSNAIANKEGITTLIQDYDVQVEKQLDEINVKLEDLENSLWTKNASLDLTTQPEGICTVLTWTAPQLSGYYMCYANIDSSISYDIDYAVTLTASGGIALTGRYTNRGSMQGGGGIDIIRVFYFEGGETVQVQTYNNPEIVKWSARATFFAIRISVE